MRKDITILDGGMGRLLQKMGAPFQQPEWSALSLIEDPEFVTQAHQAFIDAGAQVITTNTYAVVPFHIGQERFDTQAPTLIKRAAKIARDCANSNKDKNIKVAGCLPPAFGSYRPDLFNAAEFKKIYTPLIDNQENYIDFWLAETISSLAEARAICDILKENKKDLWLSFSVLDRQDEEQSPQLRSGESLAEVIEFVKTHKIDAVLFNCSQLEEMQPALEIISHANLNIPFGAYANAFPAIKKDALANDNLNQLRADACPENYLKTAQEWVDLGATLIGGCCGIGPDHIKALENLE